ncbi:MAG: GC-type dockerin domain-anchored protein [Phycisphaerales bacterium]
MWRGRLMMIVAAGTAAIGCSAVAQDLSMPGPYPGAWRSVTVTRANSTTFTARLFYPGVASGQNAELQTAGVPYPAVSFGHGFLQPVDRYQSTLLHLATWGYLVIASDSESGLFPSHANFAADLRQSLTFLEQSNQNAGSFLHQAVDASRFGMSGHSMGGGASILATAADPRVKALANLAAAETNPSATAQMGSIGVPVSLISGSADSIVPVGTNGQVMYNAGGAPKILPVIQGGWHCGFEDVSTFGCDSGPMPRAEQLALTRRLVTAFFNLYLKGDQGAWRQVWGPERNADPRVVTTSLSGIVVTPATGMAEAAGGRAAEVDLRVMNAGRTATAYRVFVEGAAWPTAASPDVTGAIAPGAEVVVRVTTQVPYGFAAATQTALVSVRADSDGGTRSYSLIEIRRRCLADIDRSGVLNINDYVAFQNAYAAGSGDADVDANGELNINDFVVFINAYAAGCI